MYQQKQKKETSIGCIALVIMLIAVICGFSKFCTTRQRRPIKRSYKSPKKRTRTSYRTSRTNRYNYNRYNRYRNSYGTQYRYKRYSSNTHWNSRKWKNYNKSLAEKKAASSEIIPSPVPYRSIARYISSKDGRTMVQDILVSKKIVKSHIDTLASWFFKKKYTNVEFLEIGVFTEEDAAKHHFDFSYPWKFVKPFYIAQISRNNEKEKINYLKSGW